MKVRFTAEIIDDNGNVIGNDGIMILQDEDGTVYEFSAVGIKKVFESFNEYINSIL